LRILADSWTVQPRLLRRTISFSRGVNSDAIRNTLVKMCELRGFIGQ
jgi:hypothetical protein